MLLERKHEVLRALEENYLILRDIDWEVLCLLWRDSEGYFAYTLEQYKLTKSDMEALLDKAGWIAFIPVIDDNVKEQYKRELDREKKKIESKIEDDYFE